MCSEFEIATSGETPPALASFEEILKKDFSAINQVRTDIGISTPYACMPRPNESNVTAAIDAGEMSVIRQALQIPRNEK
jgi:hypothetical protein